MKKTFKLTVANKTANNQLDSIKHEAKKYISRERKKKLPEKMDYWDFDCKIGDDEESATVIHVSKINSEISLLAQANNETENGKDSFYLEILAKAIQR